MKDKKHIDRLFQEKFKDFEAIPDDAVWNHIEAKLRKDKDDRKVIPIWWRFAGIAAGLILLISIGYGILNNSIEDNTSPQVVDTDNTEKVDSVKQQNTILDTKTEDIINNNLISNDPVTASDNNASKDEVAVDETLENISKTTTTKQKSKIAVSEIDTKANTASQDNNSYATPTKNNSATAETYNVPEENLKDELITKEKAASNAVANNTNSQNLPELPVNPEKNPEENLLNSSKESLAEANTIKDIEKEKDIKEESEVELQPSIEEAIALSEDEGDIDEKEEVKNRWSVTPNVAPVYFNTIGEGSSIDSQFTNNSKSGELNIGYGVNASYAVSDKLSIRSGVRKVNIGHATNNVVVYESTGFTFASSDTMPNINLDPNSQDVSVLSIETLARVPNIVAEASRASLNQEMSFIEIPVEVAYKVSDKKLDVNVIGGFSAMILNDNNIYTEINNEKTLLGKATNINSVSYSANVGIGLDYEISKRMSLNVEPTFKYQVNTFNNTSGNFAPYIVAVNSGVTFRF